MSSDLQRSLGPAQLATAGPGSGTLIMVKISFRLLVFIFVPNSFATKISNIRVPSLRNKWSVSTRNFTFMSDSIHDPNTNKEVFLSVSQNIARSSGPRSHECWWQPASQEDNEPSVFDGSGSVVWDSGDCE